MGFLDETVTGQVRERFSELEGTVRLVVFTQELECQYCRENRDLMTEIAELSDKIEIEVYNFQTDSDQVEKYGIDKIPATAIVGEKDYGIRCYGIPAGYEFSSLIEDIVDVSRGSVELGEDVLAAIKDVNEPVHIQVFVTPTCPHCPGAVRSAHKLAIASDNITADMVEVSEFPQLAVKYGVRGVPKSVANETVDWVGNMSESQVAGFVVQAGSKSV
ncbi:thioredoxin family protein [candidate division KSB1 bacterium]